MTLRHEILIAAERLNPTPFDSWDVLELVEEQTDRRWEMSTVRKELSRMRSAGLISISGVSVRTPPHRGASPSRGHLYRLCVAGLKALAESGDARTERITDGT